MTSAIASLAAYIGAASLLTVTPGLDTALVLRTATAGSPRQAALAGLGIATGCFAWATLVAFGLGALLTASHLAYTILRWVGAAYLLRVGYKMLRHPRHAFLTETASTQSNRTAFATGTLTNLLNPKVGVFYVSFLPRFVPQGAALGPYILMLGAIHALLGLIWFACLIMATRPISSFLRKAAVVQTCDRFTGGVFMTFGLGLALESRRT
jgi:threonine/homoserine/homoserine lactone efflux protein